MATGQLDEKTKTAIRLSLENFKLEHLALLGIRTEEPVIETRKVLSSPSTASFESNTCHDSTPTAFELDDHIPGQDEILIAVMGATGTGKTTFVNLVAGRDVGKVGKSLQYGTGDVSSYPVSYGGMNFTLVDTPGFDDCHHSDTDILRKISDWLAQSYRHHRKLSAILYLTRISDPRMQGSPLTNFKMFKELCGEECYSNIILGTTFWEITDSKHPGLAEQREKELVDEFWADMIERGSEVIRIPENRWLARELLVRLARKSAMTLRNQKERVDQNASLEATAASALLQEAERMKAKFEADIKQAEMKMERDREEQEKKLKNEEKARADDMNKRLDEQRKASKIIEEERLRQEEKSLRLKIENKIEMERVAKEQAELAEQLKQTKEKELQERKLRKVEFRVNTNKAQDRLRVAQQMKNVLAVIREPQKAYTLCCDYCLRNIGAHVYYECNSVLCRSSDGSNFVLCVECHAARGTYCNEKSHWAYLTKVEQTGIQNQCKRIRDPPKPGAIMLCTRCTKPMGDVYFRESRIPNTHYPGGS